MAIVKDEQTYQTVHDYCFSVEIIAASVLLKLKTSHPYPRSGCVLGTNSPKTRQGKAEPSARGSCSRPAALRRRQGARGRAAAAMWGRVPPAWGCGAGRAARFSLLFLAGRPRSKIQKLFSTSSVLSTEKDKSTTSTGSTTEAASKSPESAAETPKQKLLNIIGNMKVEVTSKKKFQRLKTREIKNQATDKLEGLDSKSSTFQEAAEDTERSKPLNRELVEAVSAVASSFPRSKEQTESELLAQLRRHEETTDKQRKGGTINIRNVISEMSVKRQSPARRGVMISNRISLAMEEDGQRIKPERFSSHSFDSRRSLREGKRLNIFTKAPPETESALKTVSSPTIWDLEFAKEIAAVTDQPPRNGFEEMIQWTKEGILWEFPIDNEAGMDDDAEFHEHIFLEKHLKGFPKEGPIRHFMELVICGLSKNPYLSVKQKIEHIEWFQKYFEEKEELVQEM
ncbi:28S ribosomal protein S31, mitochondrial [Oxyura jamaicensis]|uniref:28S ribosomal protein S31, mitochondrial n=1 Tax=Oxyura jamaicensis TaxID=8884 RepID=UPI0015A642F7|nr:28S ribosomal protein S31, mitochondrial [Oxyura jamaicensis]